MGLCDSSELPPDLILMVLEAQNREQHIAKVLQLGLTHVTGIVCTASHCLSDNWMHTCRTLNLPPWVRSPGSPGSWRDLSACAVAAVLGSPGGEFPCLLCDAPAAQLQCHTPTVKNHPGQQLK